MKNLNLKRKEFRLFLASLGKINDSCILNIKDDGIHGLTSSEDNSMYVHAFLGGEYDEMTLNFPSLNKLSKALSMVDEDYIDLIINNNNLEYRGEDLKFKYHLHEDGIITKPKVTLDKIKNFKYDIEFDLNFDFLSNLLKNSSMTSTNKLYIYTEDSKLVWKLGDDSIPNSNNFCVIGEEVMFELEDPFILKIDNLKVLSKVSKDDNMFRINSSIGVGSIISRLGNFELEYIFSSLKE